MATKTFTTGEVLTASDTNTFLANSGLVYVTSATIGSGVSTVTVSGAFSSTYDNYRIIMDGGTASAVTDLTVKLGSTATGYYSNMVYSYFNVATVSAINTANGSSFAYVGGGNTLNAHCEFDLFAPNLAKYTLLTNATWVQEGAAGGIGTTRGFLVRGV